MGHLHPDGRPVVHLSITREPDGAWLCYAAEQPAGIEHHAARRTHANANDWAREQLGLDHAPPWDTNIRDGGGEFVHHALIMPLA